MGTEIVFTPRQRRLMEEAANSSDEFEFPTSAYLLPDDGSVTFEYLTDAGTCCWILSDESLLLSKTKLEHARLWIPGTGSILAESDEAASAALVILAQLPSGLSKSHLIIHRKQFEGHLLDRELKAICVSNPSRIVAFAMFDFTPNQIQTLSTFREPIAFWPRTFSEQNMSIFFQHLLNRRTTFGKLFLRNGHGRIFKAWIAALRERQTILFDELTVELYIDRDALGLSLLECGESIKRLVLRCVRVGYVTFWQGVASRLTKASCPRRLRITSGRESFVPEILAFALGSPNCVVEEINFFGKPSKCFYTALRENQSLSRVNFESTEDVKFQDLNMWKAIADNRSIQTIGVLTCKEFKGLEDTILQIIKQNRRLQVVFEGGLSRNVDAWKAAFEPANSFNRFHCAMADKMRALDLEARNLCLREALLRSNQDLKRMNILMQYHASFVAEALKATC